MSGPIKDIIQNQNRKGRVPGGRIPPQALAMEQAVLGAIMLKSDALEEIMSVLSAEMFYKDAHMHIYRAFLELYDTSEPLDILTVKDTLEKGGKLEMAGGVYYLMELTSKVGGAANIQYHSKIIAQKYILREVIKMSDMAQKGAYEETTDPFDHLGQTLTNLEGLLSGISPKRTKSLDQVAEKFFKEQAESEKRKAEALKLGLDHLAGISSGFKHFDLLTAGYHGSDFVILAARPAMGKTAMAIQKAKTMASSGIPGAFFSLEMSATQLYLRIIAGESGINVSEIRRVEYDEKGAELMQTAGVSLRGVPIHIDDTPALSLRELKTEARRLKREENIGWIIIDYLQLMQGPKQRGGNREQEISAIARGCKELAKELDIPVIALSQLSRAVETRGGEKRPMLSDLRESGSIEQDADMVCFLYRPGYYGEEYISKFLKGMEAELDIYNPGTGMEILQKTTFLIIAKQRQGPTGDVPLFFDGKFTRFETIKSERVLQCLGGPKIKPHQTEPEQFEGEEDADMTDFNFPF